MAKIGKKGIPIKESDLKKAIVKRNNSLKYQNDVLSESIKSKTDEIKLLDHEYENESKKLGKLYKDVEFQEDRFQKIMGGVHSNETLLSEKLKKISAIEKEYFSYEESVAKLCEEEGNLKAEIRQLEFYKVKCEESKVELASYQVKKDKALEDIDSFKQKIDDLRIQYNTKIATYGAEYDELEEKAKKHEDMVLQFEQRLFNAKDQALDEEKQLNEAQARYGEDKQKMNEELQAIKNLTEDTEDRYVEWEVKINKLKDQRIKEEKKIKIAKERFANWKVGILEEVAKMKLRNKVENIDKAGLSEILNG